ncbi:unnamed protein product [Lactuca virosa]|uniref:Uncharacterized protein n=1 Tax=Lactuca virosa TaxID=75947 RepID=A0AAU9M2A4_9ASTR|nr:unnamed protein product [Lactuca virosa]
MLEDVVPDKVLDPSYVLPESPLSLTGFRSDAFSIDQLLGDPCSSINALPLAYSIGYVDPSPSCISPLTHKCKRSLTHDPFEHFLCEVSRTPLCMLSLSSGHPPPVSVEGCASFILFQEELDEACRDIARAETIISTVLCVDFKFFDRPLTLHDRYLSNEVNLRAAKGMKLDGEGIFLKAGGMHAELSVRYCVASENIFTLANQRSLLESNYEACLRENDIYRAQIAAKCF